MLACRPVVRALLVLYHRRRLLITVIHVGMIFDDGYLLIDQALELDPDSAEAHAAPPLEARARKATTWRPLTLAKSSASATIVPERSLLPVSLTSFAAYSTLAESLTPLDGFQGALPASEIKKFIDKVAGLAGDGGLSEALDAADEMLEQGAAADAAETYAAILGEEPGNARAYAGLMRAHLAAGNDAQAEAMLAETRRQEALQRQGKAER